jgi:hypothetical protein
VMTPGPVMAGKKTWLIKACGTCCGKCNDTHAC